MTLGMTQSFLDTVPLCEGPDLPQVQLLLGDPRLDDGGPRLLGGLWFLGSECARAEALPLGLKGVTALPPSKFCRPPQIALAR